MITQYKKGYMVMFENKTEAQARQEILELVGSIATVSTRKRSIRRESGSPMLPESTTGMR